MPLENHQGTVRDAVEDCACLINERRPYHFLVFRHILPTGFGHALNRSPALTPARLLFDERWRLYILCSSRCFLAQCLSSSKRRAEQRSAFPLDLWPVRTPL